MMPSKPGRRPRRPITPATRLPIRREGSRELGTARADRRVVRRHGESSVTTRTTRLDRPLQQRRQRRTGRGDKQPAQHWTHHDQQFPRRSDDASHPSRDEPDDKQHKQPSRNLGQSPTRHSTGEEAPNGREVDGSSVPLVGIGGWCGVRARHGTVLRSEWAECYSGQDGAAR
jgi:hypothetical protein